MNPYKSIREEAFEANRQLPRLGLVLFTFGNVSAADRDRAVFAIKPSGIPYDDLGPEKMVVVDFEGVAVDGKLKPSTDTLTHAVLYMNWESIGGIAHTHSTYATAWAQALRDIPLYGTTHADHGTAPVPCAAPMTDEMIEGNYEYETGQQLIRCLKERNLSPDKVEMMLAGNHGPFAWGKNADKAVYHAAVLEEIAKMAFLTEQLNPAISPLNERLIKKHFERKHGPGAYYGQ